MATRLTIPKFLIGNNPPDNLKDGTIYIDTYNKKLHVGGAGVTDLSGDFDPDELTSRVDVVESNISSVESSVDSLGSRVTALEAQEMPGGNGDPAVVQELRDAISANSAAIGTVSSAADANSAAIAANASNIAAVSSSLDNATSAIGQNTTAISALDSRVSAIEEDTGSAAVAQGAYVEVAGVAQADGKTLFTVDIADRTAYLVDAGDYNCDVAFTISDDVPFAQAMVYLKTGQNTVVTFDNNIRLVKYHDFEPFHNYILNIKAFGSTEEGSLKIVTVLEEGDEGYDDCYIQTFTDSINLASSNESQDIDLINAFDAEFINTNIFGDDEETDDVTATIYDDDDTGATISNNVLTIPADTGSDGAKTILVKFTAVALSVQYYRVVAIVVGE